MNDIPESMEVLEHSVNELMQHSDFETFVDSVMTAVALTIFDIIREPVTNTEKAALVTGAINTATEQILLAKEYDETTN